VGGNCVLHDGYCVNEFSKNSGNSHTKLSLFNRWAIGWFLHNQHEVEMIHSCKYCLKQVHLCPRCEQDVIVRTLNEFTKDGHAVSGSFILCSNPECENYGIFVQETVGSVITKCCEECKSQHPNFEAELKEMIGGFSVN
jgi:hypothetical protein